MKVVLTIFIYICRLVIKEAFMINRMYFHTIKEHFLKNKQMLFLMGPRQVGKTTLSLGSEKLINSDFYYLNWDNLDDREVLLKGPKAIADKIELFKARASAPLVIFDEIHKYRDWKTLLKGFYDSYAHDGGVKIMVTGSARLDAYFSGGDSLMGRYFRYRIHPISVGELSVRKRGESLIADPFDVEDNYLNLYQYGGFPEPFQKRDTLFHKQWTLLRDQQLFFEDVRDLSRVHELKQMQLLGHLLSKRVGSLINYSSLSKDIHVSIETIRRWMSLLESLYLIFLVSPWSKNIPRSLLKEPKIYFWDWSLITNEGSRCENFIAMHLLKSCQFWTDRGYGMFSLHFLRDKEKKEVNFIVCKDEEPWFLVEVKKSSGLLNPRLEYFQNLTGAKHAFQVVIDRDYEDIDCFSYTRPISVPARTFLSQLI